MIKVNSKLMLFYNIKVNYNFSFQKALFNQLKVKGKFITACFNIIVKPDIQCNEGKFNVLVSRTDRFFLHLTG